MITALLGGFIIGVSLALLGYPLTTWQYWVLGVPLGFLWGFFSLGLQEWILAHIKGKG